MAKLKLVIAINIVLIILDKKVNAQETEYCSGEVFEPTCGDGKIIIMESAAYGRMDIGRCIPEDIGYMGCRADVLAQFDEKCSGKKTCQVLATDAHIETSGGCRKGLLRYLSASYKCQTGLELPGVCPTSGSADVHLNQPDVYLSSDAIKDSCISKNKALTLKATDGQTMNISLINMQQNHRDAIYGSLKDLVHNRRAVFGDGPRHKSLMVDSSHLVEIAIQNRDALFILHITVSGCPNISPPNDAWMTREGDTMEVGCHSGDKSWTLKCESNQWVGAVGQCGRDVGKTATSGKRYDAESDNISPNVMVFGVSSLVILLSAVIFLTGVCLLKRRLGERRCEKRSDALHIYPPLTMNRPDDMGFSTIQPDANTTDRRMNAEPGYKSLQTVPVQYRDGTQSLNTGAPPPAYSTYMNSGASDASDSVKYYVLEDVDAITNRA